MAEIRQRQQKKPKKPKQDCEEDDLFVKRPDFGKRNLMKDEVANRLKTETKEWYQNEGCSSEEEGEEEKEEHHTICSIPGKRSVVIRKASIKSILPKTASYTLL